MYSKSEAEAVSMFYKNLSVELGRPRDGSSYRGTTPNDFAAMAMIKTLENCKMDHGMNHSAGDYNTAARAIKAIVDAYSSYINEISQRGVSREEFDKKAS